MLCIFDWQSDADWWSWCYCGNRWKQIYAQEIPSWFAFVERDNPANCVLVPCPNNDRSSATLLPLIMQNALPGTTILTDQWRSYNQLSNLGYVHNAVNHSLFFRDPVTGVHTNTIEGMWAHAKTKFRKLHTVHQLHCMNHTYQNLYGGVNFLNGNLNIWSLRLLRLCNM